MSSPPSPPSAPSASSPQRTINLSSPEKPQASLLDAARTIRPKDFTTFYQAPCARESLLTGIGAGAAIGGLRFIILLQKASRAVAKTPTTSIPTTKDGFSRRPPSSSTTGAGLDARLSLKNRIWRSCTWGVLTFSLVSTGAHIFCQRKRAIEKAAMLRATEIMARKREEKKVEAHKKKEERELRRREHEGEKVERSRWGRWFGSGDGKG